jgi:membrane-associated phospholipid phosphatase
VAWPVLLLALPAFVAIWSGWVELGERCGFGVVHPLPGIADNFQINSAITLPIGLPNHPSYPSAHSCITSAIMTVVAEALPSERGRLQEIIATAGISRMYGGIHYRFDIEAGQEIGRAAAELALAGSLR